MIIDDDKNLLIGLKSFFTKSGYQVSTASNGKDALELIHQIKPALIICDVMMPPPNGFEIQQILMEDPRTRAIPFFFLTARNAREDQLLGLRNGADDYIQKPFDPDVLLARVESAIRRARISDIEGRKSQEITAAKRIDNISAQLQALSSAPGIGPVPTQDNDVLFRTVSSFTHLYQLTGLEIWALDKNEQRKEFLIGFTVNQNGLLTSVEQVSNPLPISDQNKVPSSEFVWVSPFLQNYGQILSVQVHNLKIEDNEIDPFIVQSFLNQVCMVYCLNSNAFWQIKPNANGDFSSDFNQNAIVNILQGLSKMQELRDHETNDHTERVAILAVQLGEAAGLSGENLTNLYRGAIFHDIGKIGIPDAILRKEGPLTEQEREEIRKHPLYAQELLSKFGFLKQAIDVPLYHHERWDGSGYPHHLVGENIPLIARIFAIIDVWDAMTHARVYRGAISKIKVRAYMQEQSGKSFDPGLVDLFLNTIKQ
jgi:response regulator RpfG family c-di-GMP phosphodiesterase